MLKKIFILTTLILFLGFTTAKSQNKEIPNDFIVSKKSIELFNLINDFRLKNNLKEISLSASLSYVAAVHVNDLIANHPDTFLCNLHSWSDKGDWTACCYQAYIPIQDCMWNKPKELSPYKYRGYELAFYQDEILTAQEILSGWIEIAEASNMILNKGKWVNEWRAMGVEAKDGYAVVWFGRAADKEPKPKISGEDKLKANHQQTLITDKNNQYFLIFGSYNRLKDAEKRLLQLQKNGFESAVILQSDKKYRLALSVHQTLESAKNKLPKKYNEAWILKYE